MRRTGVKRSPRCWASLSRTDPTAQVTFPSPDAVSCMSGPGTPPGLGRTRAGPLPRPPRHPPAGGLRDPRLALGNCWAATNEPIEEAGAAGFGFECVDEITINHRCPGGQHVAILAGDRDGYFVIDFRPAVSRPDCWSRTSPVWRTGRPPSKPSRPMSMSAVMAPASGSQRVLSCGFGLDRRRAGRRSRSAGTRRGLEPIRSWFRRHERSQGGARIRVPSRCLPRRAPHPSGNAPRGPVRPWNRSGK